MVMMSDSSTMFFTMQKAQRNGTINILWLLILYRFAGIIYERSGADELLFWLWEGWKEHKAFRYQKASI